MQTFQSILGFWTPGPFEWVVIGIVAVLLFGKRLPEVGRQLGQGFVEFKKGLKGAKDEMDDAVKNADKDNGRIDDASSSTADYDEAEDDDKQA